MDLPEGSLSHERCQDFLVISEQMLKTDLADILAGASIAPEAIMKAVSLASFQLLCYLQCQNELVYEQA